LNVSSWGPEEDEMVSIIAAVAQKGFRFGVLFTALGLGFRHGIDWDHIAAITDITSSQDRSRTSLLFGTLYALGHALVVFSLGILAIVAGDRLPSGIDRIMPRVVGATLLLLGVYVFTSLIRHGRDFRLRSRWMLVFAGVRRGYRWLRARSSTFTGSRRALVRAGTSAERSADPTSSEVPESAPLWHHGHHGLPGHHHHQGELQRDDAFMNYGRATAFGVGMIHGIGAETASQLLIFLAVVGAGGAAAGVVVLSSFIIGLLASNTLITLGTTFGYLRASKNFAIYVGVAVVTGLFSLVIGSIFVLGKTTLLPAIFGG
jgi:high-affinity nickel-transport protein